MRPLQIPAATSHSADGVTNAGWANIGKVKGEGGKMSHLRLLLQGCTCCKALTVMRCQKVGLPHSIASFAMVDAGYILGGGGTLCKQRGGMKLSGDAEDKRESEKPRYNRGWLLANAVSNADHDEGSGRVPIWANVVPPLAALVPSNKSKGFCPHVREGYMLEEQSRKTPWCNFIPYQQE